MSDRYDEKASEIVDNLSVGDNLPPLEEWQHESVCSTIASALRDAAKVADGHVPAASRPKRAYQFTIEVGADTPKEMIWALEQIVRDIDRNIDTRAVSGGPSSGWVIEPDHTPGKTHDQYIEELEAYIGRRFDAEASGPDDRQNRHG